MQLVFLDGLDVDHAADVVELEVRKHPVEDLQMLANLLRVLRQRTQTLFA